MRSLCVALAAVSLHVQGGAAQELTARSPSRFDVKVQLGFLTGVDVLIPSVGVSYRVPTSRRRTMIEAHVAHSPQDRDAPGRTPAFTFVAIWVHSALRAPTAKGMQPFIITGIGVLHVDGQESVCEWPQKCFYDGSSGTAVGGAGLMVPFARAAAIRADMRLIIPVCLPDTGCGPTAIRPELAVGVAYRL